MRPKIYEWHWGLSIVFDEDKSENWVGNFWKSMTELFVWLHRGQGFTPGILGVFLGDALKCNSTFGQTCNLAAVKMKTSEHMKAGLLEFFLTPEQA